jgi:hypothetical protein
MTFSLAFLFIVLICVVPVALGVGLVGWMGRLACNLRDRRHPGAEILPIDWSKFERDLCAYASPAWTRARETEQRV